MLPSTCDCTVFLANSCNFNYSRCCESSTSATPMTTVRAKIFVSCGQRHVERHVVAQIKKLLRRLGFDTYVAYEQHTPEDVRRHIFDELESSEYYLFIDFPREELVPMPGTHLMPGTHRGSLFTHQELALASFLRLPMLGFRHSSVLPEDGVSQFILLNAIEFSDERSLLRQVKKKAKERWNPHWKNCLLITRRGAERDLVRIDSGYNRNWYHMCVSNLHHDKWAKNCAAYVTSVHRVDSRSREQHPLQIELRWSARTGPFVHIQPSSAKRYRGRMLDVGFVTYETGQNIFHHGFYSDSAYNQGRSSWSRTATLIGPGRWIIGYVVISENFPDATITLNLKMGKRPFDVSLRDVSEKTFAKSHRAML